MVDFFWYCMFSLCEVDCEIEWVKPGGPGEKSGLKVGDVVKKFGSKQLKDFQHLVVEVSGKKPGDKIGLKVKRGDEMIDVELVIGKAGR